MHSKPAHQAKDAERRIRSLIDGELPKPPLTDEDWGFLMLEGALARIREAGSDEAAIQAAVRAAARTIRNLRSVRGEAVEGEPEPARRMATEEGEGRYALSRLIALAAEEDDGVIGFRSKHLREFPDHTIPWPEIADWIARQAAADGPATEYVQLALPTGVKRTVTPQGLRVEDDTPLSEAHIESEVKARLVRYGLPGGKWVQAVPVSAGGVLNELHGQAQRLARRYGWTEDQASVFILTGVTPYMVGIRLETTERKHCPAAGRITLVIDPVVAPQEVLASYSRLRRRVLGGRYRPLSEKHLKLAVFAAENRRTGATWAHVMKLWNTEHEEYAYTQETILARDATAARRRLLGPRLNPDGLLELVVREENRAE